MSVISETIHWNGVDDYNETSITNIEYGETYYIYLTSYADGSVPTNLEIVDTITAKITSDFVENSGSFTERYCAPIRLNHIPSNGIVKLVITSYYQSFNGLDLYFKSGGDDSDSGDVYMEYDYSDTDGYGDGDFIPSFAAEPKPYHLMTRYNGRNVLLAASSDKKTTGLTISGLYGQKNIARLFSTTSSNATNIRIKANGTVYALGTLADGLINISNVRSNDDDTYNKTFIYSFCKNDMSVNYLCTLDMHTSYFYCIQEQNIYICEGSIQKTSTWSVTRPYRYAFSFDGISWSYISITTIQGVKVIQGAVYIVANIPDPDDNEDLITVIYKIANESIDIVFQADRNVYDLNNYYYNDFIITSSEVIFENYYLAASGPYELRHFSLDGSYVSRSSSTTAADFEGTKISTWDKQWQKWTGDCSVLGDKYSITYTNTSKTLSLIKYDSNGDTVATNSVTLSEPATGAEMIGAFIEN